MIPAALLELPSPLKWLGGGMAAILLVTLPALAWQAIQIKSLRTDLAAERTEAKRCAVDLGVQSIQVNTWKKAAADRHEVAEAALANAAQARAQSDARAKALYTLQLPDEECHALRLLVDTARPAAIRLPVSSPTP